MELNRIACVVRRVGKKKKKESKSRSIRFEGWKLKLERNIFLQRRINFTHDPVLRRGLRI
jgi:hypothetical protein